MWMNNKKDPFVKEWKILPNYFWNGGQLTNSKPALRMQPRINIKMQKELSQ